MSVVTSVALPMDSSTTLEITSAVNSPKSRSQKTSLTDKQSTKTINKPKIDPLRALEPARKKLCMLESQRIMSVFEDTIKRTEIVSLLPFILQNLERFNVAFGSELIGLLTTHNQIQQSYIEIRDQLNNLKRPSKDLQDLASDGGSPTPNVRRTKDITEEKIIDSTVLHDKIEKIGDDRKKETILETLESNPITKPVSVASLTSPTDMVMKQLSLVAEQLSNSCKNILRAFNSNPAAITSVLAEERHRSYVCAHFCVNLNELREILLNKLLMTPIELREKMDYLDEIAQRQRQNTVTIAKLDTDLNTNISEKDVEIKKRNEIIRKLQADLHQIDRLSDENIRRMKSDSEKQKEVDLKNSDARQQKLQTDMTYHKTQLQTQQDENKERESDLRKKKFKVETEVENWIQKYDLDMGERQDEFEEIDAIYTEEKKQLHELEERFKTLEEEYNYILEQRNLEREKREKAEREMHLMMRCATTIQAFWRSFKVRKMLKAKKKGKGKGSKK